ncbi:MAG: sigma-70 family RNA polymerase sigma factor [Thermoanaerobaculia bacterium]
MSDGELMVRTREGDRDAFSAIVHRYKDSLLNYLTHLSGNRDKAEELTQETFVRLYRNLERYEECSKLAPLLFRIGTNLVRSEQRSVFRWLSYLTRNGHEHNGHESRSPQSEILSEEAQEAVRGAISRLPLIYRSAIVLYEMEEWSYQEIADSLGCSLGTVKSRISRGRELLRRMLSPYWNGDPS